MPYSANIYLKDMALSGSTLEILLTPFAPLFITLKLHLQTIFSTVVVKKYPILFDDKMMVGKW